VDAARWLLGQEVEELETFRVTEDLADRGELGVQGLLGGALTHP
jgi:hypothetical protein